MRHSSNMTRHVRRGAKEVRHAARSVKSSANHQAHTVMRAVDKVRSEVADALKDGIDDLRDVAAGYVEQGRIPPVRWKKRLRKACSSGRWRAIWRRLDWDSVRLFLPRR